MTLHADRRAVLAGALAAALPWPANAQLRDDRSGILPLLESTAHAQIAALEAMSGLRRTGFRLYSPNWIFATFLVGLARLARTSRDPAFARYLAQIADVFDYGMGGDQSPKGLINADDHAIGDLYAEIYAHRRQPGMLLPLQQRLDFTVPYLANPVDQRRLIWWWCDALYMAPPVLARMSALTGDTKYLAAADTHWWRVHARLWDEQDGLFFRDERFVVRRSESGARILWARGNGWVLGALARMFEAMPVDFPSRPRYLALYRRMAKSIVGLQQPDGLWRASMLDPVAFPETETSGAALFAYALGFGINHGLLDRATFETPLRRAWAGLMGRIQPDGLLGWVQRAGDRPVPTRAEDKAPYATGALLLAGLEMLRLDAPIAPLPVPEPAPDAAWGRPAAPPPPGPMTAESAKEAARRDDEHAAMRDLAFDPATDDPAWRPIYR